MSLSVLLGDYGTGKTGIAKYMAKLTGGVYLDIDVLSENSSRCDSRSLVGRLCDVIKSDISYYLDGWNGHYFNGDLAKELGVTVKYIVCMAAPECVKRRQAKKAAQVTTPLPRTTTEIQSITHLCASISLTYDNDPLFVDTTTRPATFWKKEHWMNRWIEINLYDELKGKYEYQDVELSDRIIRGLSKSYKTWDCLRALVDFRGQSVCDYGCNYGYFCFKAEEAGAASIIGVDVSSSVLNTANSIAITKTSKVQFLTSDLRTYDPPDTDIIMALNILHHLNYDIGILNTIFQRASMVVIELPAKDLPIVDAIAHRHRFGNPAISSSHREDRCIVIYSQFKPVVLPRKYVYHPHRAALNKWLLHTALWCVPPFLRGKVVQIKRYVWMKLK